MVRLYYAKKLNKKGDGNFDVVYADLEYRQVYLTFDRSVIAELLGCAVGDLYSLPVGYKCEVGVIDGSKIKVK